jgi:fatty-acyl-CoA synthase
VAGIGAVIGADFDTDALVGAGKSVRNPPSISPDDPVLLIYTSGTTGLPKGCLQSQRGSTGVDELTADAMEATERDVYMAIMPYFHQAGMIRSRAVMLRGGSNVVPEGLAIDSVADHRGAQGHGDHAGVCAAKLVLVDKAMNQGRDYSALRLLISSGGRARKSCRCSSCFAARWGVTSWGSGGKPSALVSGREGRRGFLESVHLWQTDAGIELQIWVTRICRGRPERQARSWSARA